MSNTDVLPIVVDNGSDSCKVGIAREDQPTSVFPSIVARDANKVSYVGQKALEKVSVLDMHYPVNRGLITNWDDMEIIWSYMFKDVLSLDPTKHPVMMSETLNNSASNREKTAQIMFEKFQVPALCMASQAVLSLYHAGRVTGTVVDVGHGVTSVVPIYEGFSTGEAVKVDLAGYDITEYLVKLLAVKGHNLSSPANKLIAKKIKETLCSVSLQNPAPSSSAPSTFELPDKRVITLDSERHQCAEILFDPEIIDRANAKGVHRLVHGAISACDMNTRKPLYTNVLLSGGTSLLDGLSGRLQHELTAICPQNSQVKVHTRRDRHLAAWIGGSVYAALPSFRQMQITKQEYEETGPSIIQRKWP